MDILAPIKRYLTLGLMVLALGFGAVQTVRLHAERAHSAKLDMRVRELVAMVDALRKAGEESKARTERVIVQAEGSAKDAERRARRVESAPTPEGCKTAPEVMGLDI